MQNLPKSTKCCESAKLSGGKGRPPVKTSWKAADSKSGCHSARSSSLTDLFQADRSALFPGSKLPKSNPRRRRNQPKLINQFFLLMGNTILI